MSLMPTGQSQDGSGDRRAPPLNSLWVGNLPKKVTDSELMSLFRRFGPLGATSQGKRGFRFVSFKRMEDAIAAKNAMQGATVRGRHIKIELAETTAARRAKPESDARFLYNPPYLVVPCTHEGSPRRFLVESQDDNLSSCCRCDFDLTSREAEAEGRILHDPPRAVIAYTLEGFPLMFPVEPRSAKVGRYYRSGADLIPRCEVDSYLSYLDGTIEFFLQHTVASAEAYRLAVLERDQAIQDRDEARRDLDQARRNSMEPRGHFRRVIPKCREADMAATDWEDYDWW